MVIILPHNFFVFIIMFILLLVHWNYFYQYIPTWFSRIRWLRNSVCHLLHLKGWRFWTSLSSARHCFRLFDTETPPPLFTPCFTSESQSPDGFVFGCNNASLFSLLSLAFQRLCRRYFCRVNGVNGVNGKTGAQFRIKWFWYGKWRIDLLLILNCTLYRDINATVACINTLLVTGLLPALLFKLRDRTFEDALEIKLDSR